MPATTLTLSSNLKRNLDEIDSLRQAILTAPVSSQTESLLRWDTTLAHLSGWAGLSDQPLSSSQLEDTLTRPHIKRAYPLAAKILGYKAALSYIQDSWTANPAPVTFSCVQTLSGILGVQHGSQTEIESLLAYLQAKPLHPIIQSATVHLSFYPNRLCYLLSLLFLAKSGYDLRGWLSLEDYWSAHKAQYQKIIQLAASSTTPWLEYYCQAVAGQMVVLRTKLASLSAAPAPISPRLTPRQKSILRLLDQPNTSIANKQIQTLFKVSQITASRELARLASLGFLAPRGSGRSTAYIKT